MEYSRRQFFKLGAAAAGVAAFAGMAGCSPAATTNTTAANTAANTAASTIPTGGAGEKLVCIMDTGKVKPVGQILGDKLGYFKEEGVDIEFQYAAADQASASFTAIAEGTADIYPFTVTYACKYVSERNPVYIIGGTIADGTELLAAEGFSKTLKSASDFKGLKLCTTRGESGQTALKGWLLDNGIDLKSDLTFDYVESYSAGLEAVKKGEYDIMLINNAQGYSQRGKGIIVAGNVPEIIGGDYPCCRMNISVNAYEKKHDTLVAYMIACLRGYQTYKTDQATTVPILVDYSGQDTDYTIASMYGTSDYTPIMQIELDPYKDDCIKFYENYAKIGEITAPSDINFGDYIKTDIYETALNKLIEREPNNTFWSDLMTIFKKKNTK